MIKGIILDLDDTLYNYKKLNDLAIEEICKFTCKNLKISEEKFIKAFEAAKKNVKKQLTEKVASSHNRMLYCQKTLENLGENPLSLSLKMYNIYWNYILKNMKLNKNVLELLKFCKKEKIKVGICTDLTVNIQHKKIKKLKIDKYINALVTSEEAGEEKPSFKMYDLILKKLKISPQEALFIGDNLKKDVEGPSKYGMKTLLFSSEINEKYESIKNFNEVLEKLKDEKNKKS
ncbi:HAD family hydrolase [Leptotrichia sp. OH3620_COT-345]|uniref:HAD family hydrolase n=1 Tax=Leptotrichia sp. OH3620_COT-345 TaxID=2491048 RepID=UPI000F647547|nr:HAD family hydrolase [Leptotrichia sp. OH3620_COT-345]RRD40759.1 HAD family hydrolase [Leptotrichia sp. OH3620_COT-345]